jgi:hypothetical protein
MLRNVKKIVSQRNKVKPYNDSKQLAEMFLSYASGSHSGTRAFVNHDMVVAFNSTGKSVQA